MKNKINQSIIVLLLIVGFFSPTSINGVISNNLGVLHSILLSFLLGALLINNKIYKKKLIAPFIIIFVLIFFTLIHLLFDNHFLTRVSWGSLFPFISLALLFSISYSDINFSKFITFTFQFTHILIIILGVSIIYDVPFVNEFIYNNYSMGYDLLVSNMLYFDKPVSMFGSHSIASLFYYLLFYMSLTSLKVTNKKWYLFLAVFDLILLFNLNSVSCYIFFAIGIFQLFLYFFKKNIYFKTLSVPFVFIAAIIFIYSIKDSLNTTFSSTGNGFLGRYSSSGVLTANFEYISNNLLPIGLWISDNLYFTDSGFLLYYLKGSFILVLTIYIGLFLLLRQNIKNAKLSLFIFTIIFAFEIGYPILAYSRLIYFLPFVLIYMRELNNTNLKTKETKI